MCDSLYCNICFIAVVWNWSAISLRDVCRASSSTPNQYVTMDHRQDNSCWEKRRRMWSTGWWPVEILYYSCVHIIRSFCTDIGWNSLIKLEFSSQLLQAISCPLLFCGSFLHFLYPFSYLSTFEGYWRLCIPGSYMFFCSQLPILVN